MKSLQCFAALAALLTLSLAAGCPDTIEPGDPPDDDGITSIRVDPSQLELAVGGTASLSAIGDDDGTDTDLTSEVDWVSGDPNIASVSSDGTVTAQNVGTTSVTATLGIFTAFATVRVGTGVDAGPDIDGGPGGDVETSLDVVPPLASNSPDAAFGFSCSPQSCTFECELDNSGFAPCTTPRNFTALGDGLHVFRVRGVLDGTADASPAEHSWVIDTDLPETVLMTSPPAVTASGDASFALLCDENECTFECNLDGAGWAACTSPHDVTVTDGEHTFEARAVDAAGNADDSPAVHMWKVDTTPPETTFDRTPAQTAASTSAAFEFSCSESDCSFECDLDSGGWAACLSPHVALGLVDGQHTFRVRATDAAGNADGSPAEYTWTIDAGVAGLTFTTVPTSPTNLTDATFEFTCDITTCVFECQIDAGGWNACASGESLTGLADGLHTFEVRVGMTAVPAEFNWIVDSRPPETTIDTAPQDPSNLTSVAFAFSCDELACTFECDQDGAGFTSCSSPLTWNTLLDGEHTFRVRAIDAVGNVDPSVAEHVWTVNTDAPEVALDAAPADRTNDTSASFSFSCNEDNCTFECQLDDEAAAPCNSPKFYFDLEDGEHTFLVSATDPAGNKSTAPTEHTWTVDTASPVVNISASPQNPSNSTDASFVFSCSEGACTYECQLDGTGFLPCMSPHDYQSLPAGFHTFQVRATDDAGNQGQSTSFQWSIDLAGPSTTIDTAPAATTTSVDASFTFSCDEASCTYECRVDGAAFAPCTSPADYTLGYGAHSFAVRASDTASNLGPTATHDWTIECSADGECGADQLCESGACVPGNCRSENDCGVGELCENSFCSGCSVDGDCGPGAVCLADGLCAQSPFGTGADGDAVVSSVVDLTTASISGRPVPDASAYRVLGLGTSSATLATTVVPGALVPGDEVLLIALRGTQDWVTGARYQANVGEWETLFVDTVNGTAVTFTTSVAGNYGQIDNSVLDAERIVGLYRVPQYSSLTVGAGGVLTTRTFQPLAGRPSRNNVVNAAVIGGVLFVRVSGQLLVQSGGSINLTGLGYRGGRRNEDNGDDGQAGEGLAGFSKNGCNCGGGLTGFNLANEPYSPLHENAGGGGSYITGGGGGYGTAGSEPPILWRDDATAKAEGGGTYGSPELATLHFGAGGGAAYNSSNTCVNGEGPGAQGGGLLVLAARTATIDGSVLVDGADAIFGNRSYNAYGTGGGAGGTLWLSVDDLTLNGTVSATGGAGFDPVGCAGTETPPNRGGGDGGDGRVRVDYARVNGNDFGSGGADAALATISPAPGFTAHP